MPILQAGQNTITATYGGNDFFLGSKATLTQTVRCITTLLIVLAAGVQVGCGSPSDSGDDCGRSPTASQPRTPRTGPTGAAGSTPIPRHSAPPPTAVPSRPPLPTPVNGRLSVTAANTGQTIVVPANTVIEVRLEPVSGSVWTVPETSDPQALPRLSASHACDTIKEATFRAVAGSGEIIATRPHGDAEGRLIVTIRVGGPIDIAPYR